MEFGGLPGTGKSTLARQLAERTGAVWLRVDEVIETRCAEDEHRHRVRTRANDVPGWTYPDWDGVLARRAEYEPRTDERLVVDTTRPVQVCHDEIARHLGR